MAGSTVVKRVCDQMCGFHSSYKSLLKMETKIAPIDERWHVTALSDSLVNQENVATLLKWKLESKQTDLIGLKDSSCNM